MFEQAFRNIDDVLRKEAGCTTELDYTEQTSWLLFLKYLDALEQDKADEAARSSPRSRRSSTPKTATSSTCWPTSPMPLRPSLARNGPRKPGPSSASAS